MRGVLWPSRVRCDVFTWLLPPSIVNVCWSILMIAIKSCSGNSNARIRHLFKQFCRKKVELVTLHVKVLASVTSDKKESALYQRIWSSYFCHENQVNVWQRLTCCSPWSSRGLRNNCRRRYWTTLDIYRISSRIHVQLRMENMTVDKLRGRVAKIAVKLTDVQFSYNLQRSCRQSSHLTTRRHDV